MNDNNDNNDINDTKVTNDKVESNTLSVNKRSKHSYLYSAAGDPTAHALIVTRIVPCESCERGSK